MPAAPPPATKPNDFTIYGAFRLACATLVTIRQRHTTRKLTMTQSIPTLETERLILRGAQPDDLEPYHAAIAADPDVMRYLPGGVPRPIERTRQTLEAFAQCWQERGFGGFVVVHKASGDVIGQAGLWPIPMSDGSEPEVEVFYALAKAYWGQGLASEAAHAVISDGFSRVGLARIVGVAYPENEASQRVMSKVGMQSDGLCSRYYNTEMACFSLSREAWLGQQ
jgi:RimJ/RimL family protein N-acetyltransferase